LEFIAEDLKTNFKKLRGEF